MPMFKKSKNGDAQRLAELELQQTTLSEIDTGISSERYVGNTGPWYTPTSVGGTPGGGGVFRNSTPRTSSSFGFSPASTLPSPGTSRASSPFNSPPQSPPPSTTTDGRGRGGGGARRPRGGEGGSDRTPRFDYTDARPTRTPASRPATTTPSAKSANNNLTYTKTPPVKNNNTANRTPSTGSSSTKKAAESPKKPLSSLLRQTFTKLPTKLPTLSRPSSRTSTPGVTPSKDQTTRSAPPSSAAATPVKSPTRNSAGTSPEKKQGRSPSSPTWAPSGREIPMVKVVTRDGEKIIPITEVTPNMRPRPGNVPKITRKVQTEPVDDNFQLITPHKYEEDEPKWLRTYTKHKKIIWVVFAIVVFFLAIIIALAASNGTPNIYQGAFASFLGDTCLHSCRHRDRYAETPLIVIALDGFRHDYLQKYKKELPNIRRLSECGTTAKLMPSFPAETTPNLWTIVSGYYPQFHGVVSDWILDYKTGEEFNPRVDPTGPGTVDAGWFHDPALWEIARKQGKITASHSWIGNNLKSVDGNDRKPTYHSRFARSINYMSRMQTVLDWMNLPTSQRPTYTTVYFEDPGFTARNHGTTSSQVASVLIEIDEAIGLLLDTLMEEEVVDCFNIMIVSTTGMTDTNCDRVYYLNDDITNLDDFTVSPDYLGSIARITPKETAPEDMDSEREIINHLQCDIDNGHPYLTDDLPYRLHGAYGHHLEEAVILMEEGWTFAKKQNGYDRSNCRGANNGYDPYLNNMAGIFIGFGKDLKIGHTVGSFQNIELFNLMSELIGVETRYRAEPSDGSPGFLNNVLKQPGPNPPLQWNLLTPGTGDRGCPYPEIRKDVDVGCTCSEEALSVLQETAGVTIEEKDENLNLVQLGGSTELNAPFGIPGVKDGTNTDGEFFCILYQDNYITGYDHFLEIPTFVSFTIDDRTGSVPYVKNCTRFDQRLDPEKTPQCSDYDELFDELVHTVRPITLTYLYQPSLAGNLNAEFDALITSNIVPQYTRFTEEIWAPLADRLREWAVSVENVHIVAGPAYDLNRDSHKDSYFDIGASNSWIGDTPVPTHYFLVATRCQTSNGSVTDKPLKDCTYNEIATMTYIFPHTNDIPECFNFDEYLTRNRATLHDVETLTGLAFYPDWSMDASTRMEMLRYKKKFSYNSWIVF